MTQMRVEASDDAGLRVATQATQSMNAARTLHFAVGRWVTADSRLLPHEILLIARRTERLRVAARVATSTNCSSLAYHLAQVREAIPDGRASDEVLEALGQMDQEVSRLGRIHAVEAPPVTAENDADWLDDVVDARRGANWMTVAVIALLLIAGVALILAP
jgi:hypothetical protein